VLAKLPNLQEIDLSYTAVTDLSPLLGRKEPLTLRCDGLPESVVAKVRGDKLIMGLFKPVWMRDNKEKALKAVEKLTYQQMLAQIANNDPIADVYIAAVKRLTDQSILADNAKNDNACDVRREAVENLQIKLYLPILRKATGLAMSAERWS
jgi:hypothetical protein